MASPLYNAIKGTTSGAPGTGAFTPNAAATGFLAWSTVATGWVGLVRFEDTSNAWELRYCYWNGTTLSRSANAFVASSSGSGLTLTSAATATMVADANEIQPHLGGTPLRGWLAFANSTTSPWPFGTSALTITGTAAAAAIAATNILTEQVRHQANSATTAHAQAGWSQTQPLVVYSTTAGRGGWEYTARFGAAQLPTSPKLFCGLTTTTLVALNTEPSALTANLAVFGKDSTDTNIQFITNSNAGSGTKTDTGIPLVANDFYEATIWSDPGGGRIYGLLVRLGTGDIWYGSTTSDLPANGSLLFMNTIGGLSATTGTAFQMCIASVMIRGAK